jgi:hypothetical protein
MTAFEFFGETFQLRAQVPQIAILEFADAAEKLDDSKHQTASMFRLIKACIPKSEWQRFYDTALDNDATVEQMMPAVQAAMQQESERPTGRPIGSSDGPEVTPQRSELPPAIEATALPDRPDRDLALVRSA